MAYRDDARRFTDQEAHLLVHAADMGGWLAVSYSRGDYEQPMNALLRDGLFRRSGSGGWHRHELTAAGVRMAAVLAAPR